MKKLLLSGIFLLTQISSPLYGASRAQQEYAAQLAAAQALLDLAELDLLIAEDRDFFISMMQTENVTREIGTDSALTREERKALSTIAEALLDMHQDKTIQLSVTDNDTIRTYINPPKAPFIAAPEKPVSGQKEGSHEWHLAMLRQELRTRLSSLGAAARDATIKFYNGIVKEKNKALKVIETKIADRKTKNKPALETEKGAIRTFVKELENKVKELRTQSAQKITEQRMQEKAARPMAAAASLERKPKVDSIINRYAELEYQIKALPQEDTLETLTRRAQLFAEKDALADSSPQLQRLISERYATDMKEAQSRLELFKKIITNDNYQETRQELLALISNLDPDFFNYPKDGKKEQIKRIRDCLIFNKTTNSFNKKASLRALQQLNNLCEEAAFLKDVITMYLETSSERHPLSGIQISDFINSIVQRLFPEEHVKKLEETMLS